MVISILKKGDIHHFVKCLLSFAAFTKLMKKYLMIFIHISFIWMTFSVKKYFIRNLINNYATDFGMNM